MSPEWVEFEWHAWQRRAGSKDWNPVPPVISTDIRNRVGVMKQ